MSDAFDSLQQLIDYEFKDRSLLVSAFTHSSYVNEHKGVANERLEFLGDCVLNFLVGVKYYEDYRDEDEGTLSSMRASVVSKQPLATLVDELGLTEYLRVGAGTNTAEFSDKTRSNVFEALLGAMYLDGGLEACDRFLSRVFYGKVQPVRDYKSELQKRVGAPIDYKVTDEGNGQFVAVAMIGENKFSGRGSTKKAAEIDAAKSAVNALDNKDK